MVHCLVRNIQICGISDALILHINIVACRGSRHTRITTPKRRDISAMTSHCCDRFRIVEVPETTRRELSEDSSAAAPPHLYLVLAELREWLNFYSYDISNRAPEPAKIIKLGPAGVLQAP